MARSEIEPKIFIPSRITGVITEAVSASRVSGDTSMAPSFELIGNESYIDSLKRGRAIRKTLQNGGRVFITEGDDILLVRPDRK